MVYKVASVVIALALTHPGLTLAVPQAEPSKAHNEQTRDPQILTALFKKPLEELRDRYLEDQKRNTIRAVMSACLDSFPFCPTNWKLWYRVNFVDYDGVCLTIGPIQHSMVREILPGDRSPEMGPKPPYNGPGPEVLKRLQTASYPFPVYSGSDCPVSDEHIVDKYDPAASRVYQFVHATVEPLGPSTVRATVSSSAHHGERYTFKRQEQGQGWDQELEDSWDMFCTVGMWRFKIAVR